MPIPVMLALVAGGLSIAALAEPKHAQPNNIGANAAADGGPVNVTVSDTGRPQVNAETVTAPSGHSGGTNGGTPIQPQSDIVAAGENVVAKASSAVETAIRLATFPSNITDQALGDRVMTANRGIGGMIW